MVSNISEFPDELVAAVAEGAARDADHVVQFLRALGLEASPTKPMHLPAAFLLELGAALRLFRWEYCGLHTHLDAGLPPSSQAIRDAFRHLDGSGPLEMTLAYRVLVLFAERFAWSAREELDAQVALGEADEDALLEALADFLWEHRPD
jgi:hypothetical protein